MVFCADDDQAQLPRHVKKLHGIALSLLHSAFILGGN